jgi:hypothetical protein
MSQLDLLQSVAKAEFANVEQSDLVVKIQVIKGILNRQRPQFASTRRLGYQFDRFHSIVQMRWLNGQLSRLS